MRRLLTFIRHYGLDHGADLAWRVVVGFFRYFEDNHRKASCDLDMECEKKRRVNNY